MRVDFNKSEFDRLITEKGRGVLIEKALRCPCKINSASGSLSSCKNCGSTGWIFVNPKQSRIVLQGIDVTTKLEGWSEENRGVVRISALAEDELAFMDRITVMDQGYSTYTEVINFKKKGSIVFAYSTYTIQNLKYAGLFVSTTQKLTVLQETVDFTIEGNIFKLDPVKYATVDPITISVSLRYEHYPVFHIIEMKRDTIQSFRLNEGVEDNQVLPISGYARRAHYILDAPNLNGDRLLNNDYVE